MYPTLEPGQFIVIWRRSKLKCNDIIVFVYEGAEKIKRICGMEGEFLYVLGDDPHYSTDSRQYGYINRSSVVGAVVFPHERMD